MNRPFNKDRVLEGALINEILFGQDYGSYLRCVEATGFRLNVDFDDCYLCLTGIPKKFYVKRFGKCLDDFLRVYDALKARVGEEFAAQGIAFDMTVVKYDESKRICCMMSVPDGLAVSACDAASFVHRALTDAYRELWGLGDADYVCVTALSDRLSGFDALYPGFKGTRQLANLFYFLDESTVMTGSRYRELHRPLEPHGLLARLAEIERCLVRADGERLDAAVGLLFREDLRHSFDFHLCGCALAELGRLIVRYDEVFLANLDRDRCARLSMRNHYSLESAHDEVRSLLQECLRASSSTGLEIGSISLETVRYLREHYAQSFTVGSMAQRIGVSPNYLSRVFNEEVGESIPSYLTKVRLDRVKVLLETTEEPVAAVGVSVGFNNAQYFNHIFKQRIGETPAQYRAKRACRV